VHRSVGRSLLAAAALAFVAAIVFAGHCSRAAEGAALVSVFAVGVLITAGGLALRWSSGRRRPPFWWVVVILLEAVASSFLTFFLAASRAFNECAF
jgi:hypothetical protein